MLEVVVGLVLRSKGLAGHWRRYWGEPEGEFWCWRGSVEVAGR